MSCLEHVAVYYARKFVSQMMETNGFKKNEGGFGGPIDVDTFFKRVVDFAKEEALSEIHKAYGEFHTLKSIKTSTLTVQLGGRVKKVYEIFLDGDSECCSGYKFIQGALGEIFGLVWFSIYGEKVGCGPLIGTSHDRYARGFDMFARASSDITLKARNGIQVKTYADGGKVFTRQNLFTMMQVLQGWNLHRAILFVPTSKFTSKNDVLSYKEDFNKCKDVLFIGQYEVVNQIKNGNGFAMFWEYFCEQVQAMQIPWNEYPVTMIMDDFGQNVIPF